MAYRRRNLPLSWQGMNLPNQHHQRQIMIRSWTWTVEEDRPATPPIGEPQLARHLPHGAQRISVSEKCFFFVSRPCLAQLLLSLAAMILATVLCPQVLCTVCADWTQFMISLKLFDFNLHPFTKLCNDWKLFSEDISCIWYLASDATPSNIKTHKRSRQKASLKLDCVSDRILECSPLQFHHLDFPPTPDFVNTARITSGSPPVCRQPTYALTSAPGRCIPPVMQSQSLV